MAVEHKHQSRNAVLAFWLVYILTRPLGASIGGPDTYTFKETMELAFQACGKTPWITELPMWLAEGGLMVTGLFNRNLADLLSFAVEALKFDHVAPAYGTRHLKDFFAEMAAAKH